eukprot:TRINITY_DN1724_c0_g1_i1.p1 TRINITY_DN1724_c0_g1~~TRINITY_DN1724_c0_g1_i1.p1  ORF type:complete len:151 (-),score=35.93 TRINITY_DN1724_c0_g1_i1:68-520(-)
MENYIGNDEIALPPPPSPLKFLRNAPILLPPTILPPPILHKPSSYNKVVHKIPFPSTGSQGSQGSGSNSNSNAPEKEEKSPRVKLVQPSPNNVRSLMELGYPQEVAEFSLWLHGDNFEDTLEDLLTNSNEEELPTYSRSDSKIMHADIDL